MANIKDLKRRISSLRNMQKVMGAMNMIATIKLQKLFALQSSLHRFDAAVNAIARDIGAALKHTSHPVIDGYPTARKAHVLVLTADKGLCGAHNNSVQKAVDALAKTNLDEGVALEMSCIGSKGASYCRRRRYEIFQQTEMSDRLFNGNAVRQIISKIYLRFQDDDVQSIFMVYNRFVSMLHQETITTQLIPFSFPEDLQAEPAEMNFETEPPGERFIVTAAGLYLVYKLRVAVADSLLSEHAARMTAMENATNNSEDLINRYMTLQNRARQASITREIIEIISGKEASRG